MIGLRTRKCCLCHRNLYPWWDSLGLWHWCGVDYECTFDMETHKYDGISVTDRGNYRFYHVKCIKEKGDKVL